MTKPAKAIPAEIPDGYISDSQGRLVPTHMVKSKDLARHKLVTSLTKLALDHQGKTQALRDKSMDRIDAFVAKSFKHYGTQIGGKQGNLTLTSYDGDMQIRISISHDISFNENMLVAKKLIDECLQEWSKNSRSELRVLIDQAFQTSDDGSLSVSRILGLRSLKIKDLKWKRAMTALNESIVPGSKKPYLRFYLKDESGELKQIALDMSKLPAMEAANGR